MATGGIFKLIANDGKRDRMLMATHLLNMFYRGFNAIPEDVILAYILPCLMFSRNMKTFALLNKRCYLIYEKFIKKINNNKHIIRSLFTS
jgi:hypothetical protein